MSTWRSLWPARVCYAAAMPRRSARCLAFAASLLAAACTRPHPPLPIDPEAPFAAPREHGGLVVDRLAGGRTGRVRPRGWTLRAGAPTFVLESSSETLAAFWLPATARVVARRTPAPAAAPLGEIAP